MNERKKERSNLILAIKVNDFSTLKALDVCHVCGEN